jgi:hypothetical protein
VLDLFLQSALLFLRGKLFRSPLHVAQRAAVGVVVTALSCVLLVKWMGTLWPPVLVSALLGGALQPWLFKDLKYN